MPHDDAEPAVRSVHTTRHDDTFLEEAKEAWQRCPGNCFAVIGTGHRRDDLAARLAAELPLMPVVRDNAAAISSFMFEGPVTEWPGARS